MYVCIALCKHYYSAVMLRDFLMIYTLRSYVTYCKSTISANWKYYYCFSATSFLRNQVRFSWFRNVFLLSSILPKNERKNSTKLQWYLKLNCFRSFLEELKTPKRHFEINWPLQVPTMCWSTFWSIVFAFISFQFSNSAVIFRNSLLIFFSAKNLNKNSSWQYCWISRIICQIFRWNGKQKRLSEDY